MITKCGVNGEALEDNAILVCHHCGTPVCRAHGWVVTSDPAFADADAVPADRADVYPGAQVAAPHAPPPPNWPMSAQPGQGPSANVPSAMHCRKCAGEFHRSVTSRARIESRLRTVGSAGLAGRS